MIRAIPKATQYGRATTWRPSGRVAAPHRCSEACRRRAACHVIQFLSLHAGLGHDTVVVLRLVGVELRRLAAARWSSDWRSGRPPRCLSSSDRRPGRAKSASGLAGRTCELTWLPMSVPSAATAQQQDSQERHEDGYRTPFVASMPQPQDMRSPPCRPRGSRSRVRLTLPPFGIGMNPMIDGVGVHGDVDLGRAHHGTAEAGRALGDRRLRGVHRRHLVLHVRLDAVPVQQLPTSRRRATELRGMAASSTRRRSTSRTGSSRTARGQHEARDQRELHRGSASLPRRLSALRSLVIRLARFFSPRRPWRGHRGPTVREPEIRGMTARPVTRIGEPLPHALSL